MIARRYSYSRDKRADRPQLVIGLLCASDGCPVAVEVFEGNTAALVHMLQGRVECRSHSWS
jgi:transposase